MSVLCVSLLAFYRVFFGGCAGVGAAVLDLLKTLLSNIYIYYIL